MSHLLRFEGPRDEGKRYVTDLSFCSVSAHLDFFFCPLSNTKGPVPTFIGTSLKGTSNPECTTVETLTLLEPQSCFGDKPTLYPSSLCPVLGTNQLYFQVVCALNGSTVLPAVLLCLQPSHSEVTIYSTL